MAKRGGFPGGMPGNMNNLMKQAQKMQRQMEEAQKELEEKEITAAAGGGWLLQPDGQHDPEVPERGTQGFFADRR